MKPTQKNDFSDLQRRRFYYTPIIVLFFLLSAQRDSICQTQITPTNVMVGDIVQIGQIGDTVYAQTCMPISITYTHHQGSDFSLITPYNIMYQHYSMSGGYVIFSPTKLGIKCDTFNVITSWWYHNDSACNYTENSGPIFICSTGISDSVILVRSFPRYNSQIIMNWNQDSNKYISDSHGTFELINNVEDSTKFELNVPIDTIAHVRTMLVIGSDSSQLPNIYECEPKIRSRKGSIYFYSNSKGFLHDTGFNASLNVIYKSSILDTTKIKYFLVFHAKPIESVLSSQDKKTEEIQIFFVTGSQNISISSNFSQHENTNVQLFDVFGRPQTLPNSQLFIPSGTTTEKLEVGNLPSGWYMLRMKTKDQVINKSFIVIR